MAGISELTEAEDSSYLAGFLRGYSGSDGWVISYKRGAGYWARSHEIVLSEQPTAEACCREWSRELAEAGLRDKYR